ncbi:MAG: hypothetical protein F6K37_08185 [Moorea sp. SIO4E2]|uniref:hypothetical protein n=1 Tax=Moorena sp. SIO4E2 TaxID=2607826 RepID=UPI0013B6BEBE|nr:hypothetical protein [Moorena sp. SIO4E2]NEQ05925.1 hypothetical protein [Moorena sp. SIO4E2]
MKFDLVVRYGTYFHKTGYSLLLGESVPNAPYGFHESDTIIIFLFPTPNSRFPTPNSRFPTP